MTHHHAAHAENTSGQKTLGAYVTGYTLSIVLTLFAFGLVYVRVLSDGLLYTALAVLAIAQLVVQSICFLRLNNSKEGQWNLLPYLFMILIVAILAGGSLWIMYNLSYNMIH